MPPPPELLVVNEGETEFSDEEQSVVDDEFEELGAHEEFEELRAPEEDIILNEDEAQNSDRPGVETLEHEH